MTVHQTAIADAPSRDAETAMLFSPFALGAIALRHRVVHAPTTRLRADPDDTPSAMMVDYYGQRASAGGLIITESAHPSYDSRGDAGAPGIYTDAHIAGWRRIADAVHAKGGRLVMQIAHDGRQSHVDLSHGAAPVAPSVVPFEGQALTKNGWVPVSARRALTSDGIAGLVESFRRAAERARAAGMDGVELHNANGYLADTFLQDGTNKRTDQYVDRSKTACASRPNSSRRWSPSGGQAGSVCASRRAVNGAPSRTTTRRRPSAPSASG